jgi:hypothetical protein
MTGAAEAQIERDLISKLQELKYEYRSDIQCPSSEHSAQLAA